MIDGDGFETGQATVEYTGVGDGEAIVTAEECVGLDREGTATWKADGCSDVERRVFQLGLREEFTDRDFLVADGGTFHVLKESA